MSTSMQRREFITLLGGAATWPLAAKAQQSGGARPLVACLSSGIPGKAPVVIAFKQGLRDLGYIEGRNIEVVYRFAENHPERLPTLVDEIVRLNPAVIMAAAVVDTVAVRKATTTIPIVTAALADPVSLGLVASIARPGGNVTGIMPYVDGLPAKQMELAREVVPGASKVGILANLDDPKAPPQQRELEGAARLLNVQVLAPTVRKPEDIDTAVAILADARVQVVIALQTVMIINERDRIAALMTANRLPTVYGYREHVDAGGLISYGVDLAWCGRRAAYYVQKILTGTPPSDLPVEFPTRLEMVVNLKAAKSIGLTIPELFLVRADEVIE
jgi:putative tryptophan/tyrosine transport system substrate-binding protein